MRRDIKNFLSVSHVVMNICVCMCVCVSVCVFISLGPSLPQHIIFLHTCLASHQERDRER